MVPEFDLARSIISSRTAAGLTQAQLAERMNTTQSVIARLEPGAPIRPSRRWRGWHRPRVLASRSVSSRNRTTRSDVRTVGRSPQRRGSCGCRCTGFAASVLFGSLLQPLVSGNGLPPFQAAVIGPIHWRWWSRSQADVNVGSQQGDLSIAQSNLHPGLHPGLRSRTRHRASATVRRHWRPPYRRHESIRNGELRLGQPRI